MFADDCDLAALFHKMMLPILFLKLLITVFKWASNHTDLAFLLKMIKNFFISFWLLIGWALWSWATINNLFIEDTSL